MTQLPAGPTLWAMSSTPDGTNPETSKEEPTDLPPRLGGVSGRHGEGGVSDRRGGARTAPADKLNELHKLNKQRENWEKRE